MSHRALQSVLVGALLLAAPIARAAEGGLALQPGSKLWLTGSSTVHEFSSTTSKLNAVFRSEAMDPALEGGVAIETLIRNRGVSSIAVAIPVTDLHSGKAGLDKNMYKALMAPKYPEIRFVMSGYEVKDGAKSGEMSIDAKGKLTVAGVEKEMAIAASVSRDGDAVRLRGRVPLKMTQFGIKPPTMMMGALRTSDDVMVQFDLLIGAEAQTLSGADVKSGSR